MALTQDDWASIYEAIRSFIAPDNVVIGKVVKRNEAKKLVWLKEFGSQPIPMVGWAYDVKTYDTTPQGTKVKTQVITPKVPKVGQTVMVIRQMGTRRLPKCVGLILSPKGSFTA